ncbi:MAG: ribosome biogenesis GTP-binding protein YihA/YsxC [Rickettsiales bacterium]
MEVKDSKAINLTQQELSISLEIATEAERCFSGSCQFEIGITDFNLFPTSHLPEFAFIGRSNVGKSSLLNALVKYKKLARVSVTPGRTQQVNFFNLSDRLRLVDLPGYGFAKAPKNLVKAWERMSLGYIKNRVSLKRLFLLIDSRHGFKKNDLEFMMVLDKQGVSYQVILTKMDKTNKEQINSIIKYAQENHTKHPAMFPEIVLTSSKQLQGIKDLRAYIYNAMLG